MQGRIVLRVSTGRVIERNLKKKKRKGKKSWKLKYTRPLSGSVTYLIRNINACLEALPKPLQRPWGWDWLGNHLLQSLGDPGEHTAPHAAREGGEAGWDTPSQASNPRPKAKWCCTLEGARVIPLKHRAWVLRDRKSHLLFHFFNGSRKTNQKVFPSLLSQCRWVTTGRGTMTLYPSPPVPPLQGLTLGVCMISSVPRATSLSCRSLWGKKQKVSESEVQGTVSPTQRWL